jgi:hypothetical protein
MKRCGKEHEPEEDDADALENAQGAGLETEPILGVESVAHQARAGDDAYQVDEAGA